MSMKIGCFILCYHTIKKKIHQNSPQKHVFSLAFVFGLSLQTRRTDAERLLWSKLRNKQLKDKQFYRQKIICDCIVDFFCPKADLVIEVDGGQHYSSEGKERDGVRDERMSRMGLKVLRFSDYGVLKNIDGLIDVILRCL